MSFYPFDKGVGVSQIQLVLETEVILLLPAV